jgi:hypothetical protein
MTTTVTRLLLAATASLGWLAPAQAMTFNFVPLSINNCTIDCPKVIVASGSMQFDDIGTLIETLRAGIARDKTIRPVVLISSNGGNVAAGYGIGEVFRSIKATVIVARAVPSGSGYTIAPGGCASACVFALMGGVKRVVPDGSKLGVHWMSAPTPQMFSGSMILPDTGADDDSDADERRMRQFMRRMGVRPELASFIRKVPNSQFHVMTAQEMTRFGLARTTWR